MQEVHDAALTERFRREWKVGEIFTNPQIPVRFYTYQKGESLLVLHPLSRYIKFLVTGTIRIYTITPDGGEYLILRGDQQEFLSKWHIGPVHQQLMHVEAVTPVVTAELLLDTWEEVLMDDPKFLRFLLARISASFRSFAGAGAPFFRRGGHGHPPALQPQSAPEGPSGPDRRRKAPPHRKGLLSTHIR